MNIHPLGDHAISIAFEEEINEQVLSKVLQYKSALENLSGVTEISTAYCSLTVYYDPFVIDYSKLKNAAESHEFVPKHVLDTGKKWEIPVCYCNKLASDLDFVLTSLSITLDELISGHTNPEYRVYMKGFLPGFVYLGGLEKQLFIERKAIPIQSVPAGSVAIGGKQTGLYGFSSPGGWHVIGRTPISGYTYLKEIKAGDKISFYSVKEDEYNSIRQKVKAQSYKFDTDD